MNTNLPLTPAKSTPRKAKATLTQSYLKSILSYDPETGVFTWKERQDVECPAQWNSHYVGKEAGCKQKIAHAFYRRIRIKGKKYGAHRLAWLYMTGEWPPRQIDHIDGNALNNRFENLRLATPAQNLVNRGAHKNNKLGIKGVSKFRNKYKAQIQARGQKIHLGCFKTPEEASAAYTKAAEKYFGVFAKVDNLKPPPEGLEVEQ